IPTVSARWRGWPSVSPAPTSGTHSGGAVEERVADRSETSPQQKLEDYERRFRLMDEQMRVLERERQKLSAVVNHTDAGFLTFDASLSVTWTNNIFAARFCASPSPAAVRGAKCHEVLCGRPQPCETCPAAQPFRSGIVAHQ